MRNKFHGCVMANSPVSHSGSSNSNAHKLNVGYIHLVLTFQREPYTAANHLWSSQRDTPDKHFTNISGQFRETLQTDTQDRHT